MKHENIQNEESEEISKPEKEENLAKSPKDVICQLLPLGCIRYCACAVSNICSQRLISEKWNYLKKIERKYSKELFQILSTEKKLRK